MDLEGFGKLSGDSKDYRKVMPHENGVLVEEGYFSDPEDFVDKVSDDGLWFLFSLRYIFFHLVFQQHVAGLKIKGRCSKKA